jgi:5-methylthioadenosine/S-adenosylhomocysteine deaminase
LPFTEWLRRIYACGTVVTEADFEVSARLGALEAIHSGTTTILEHHFLNGLADGPSATITAMKAVGIRTVFARTSMDIGDLAPPSTLETPDEAVRAAERLIDAYDGERAAGLVRIFVGPNTPGISAGPDMARAMTGLATARDVGQSIHLAESSATVERVRSHFGVDGVARWLDAIGALQGRIVAAHSVHLDPGEIEILSERGVAISHNPVSNLFLGDGIAPVWEARQAGVNVALGTDGAASNNSQDMFEVLKLSGLLQRARRLDAHAVGPAEALRMATIDGARALGLDSLVGSIELGKRADLVIADMLRSPHAVAVHDVVSQLVHCGRPSDVRTVIVDGRVLLDDGYPVEFDEQELLSAAQVAGRDLVSRLG